MQNISKKNYTAQNQTEMTTKSVFDHYVRAYRIPTQEGGKLAQMGPIAKQHSQTKSYY